MTQPTRTFIHKIKRYSFILWIISLSGCMLNSSIPSAELRTEQATRLAASAGWQGSTLHSGNFSFKSYGPITTPSTILTIYIEGDGLAWLSVDTPSNNPTPLNPMGLKLALRDKKHERVVYLARPCQFVFGADWGTCQVDYWTNLRFSPAIIKATQRAIDVLKKRYAAKKIILIGYSGGGTIATLVAAKRSDVIRLITIASVLDTEMWVRQQSLTPLHGSLNPADEWQTLVNTPQTHWVGGHDTVVPKAISFAYADRFPVAKRPEIKVVPSYDHACCWATLWDPA